MRATATCALAAALWVSVSQAEAQPPRELAKWLTPQRWEKDVAGPIISLGAAGAFDDMHIFAPAVIEEKGKFLLCYCGSRGTRAKRVFRLGADMSAGAAATDVTFIDLWIRGIDTTRLRAGAPFHLRLVFEMTGNQLFDTTCGKRSLPLLEPVEAGKGGVVLP